MNTKIALITGGSRGIGKAIAKSFASSGYQVWITGRNELEGRAAASEIAGECQTDTFFVRCDLQEPDQIRTAVQIVLSRSGNIDVLVNNAGIYPAAPLLNMKLEDFDRIYSINVRGAFEMSREVAVQSMIPEDGGKILFVSSVDGWKPSAGIVAYAASKAAVNSLVKSFAIELADSHIQVNGIAPGWVATETVLKAGRWKTQMDGVLEKRMAEPDEIGRALVSMCSDAFSYMDGEVVNFSGGLILNA